MKNKLSKVFNFAGLTFVHGDVVTIEFVDRYTFKEPTGIELTVKDTTGTIVQISEKEITLLQERDTFPDADYSLEFIKIKDITKVYTNYTPVPNPLIRTLKRLRVNYRNKKMLRNTIKEKYKKIKYKKYSALK